MSINSEGIFFDLNKKVALQVRSSVPGSNLTWCSSLTISFIYQNKAYPVHWSGSMSDVRDLVHVLYKGLADELRLSTMMRCDIGFLYNQFYYAENNNIIWDGEIYLLWHNQYVTWVYNNDEGDIVWEVTPLYLGYWQTTSQPYSQWIKHYKPVFKGIIPRDIAYALIDQAKKIMSLTK